jgi:hypothetical protein
MTYVFHWNDHKYLIPMTKHLNQGLMFRNASDATRLDSNLPSKRGPPQTHYSIWTRLDLPSPTFFAVFAITTVRTVNLVLPCQLLPQKFENINNDEQRHQRTEQRHEQQR